MKKILRKIMASLILFSVLVAGITIPSNANVAYAASSGEVRACWISFLDIDYYLKDCNEATYKARVTSMCDKMIEYSVNTVIFQVRPMGDAIYNSSIYPWSTYINSTRKNPGYDPLKIFIQVAHSKGLRFEAWFNPFRLANSTRTTEQYKATEFYNKNKDCIIEYSSGGQSRLSLDPGNAKARKNIIDGVCEVVKNYDVDGVHFDDYFYVSGLKDELSVAERKNNVNALVKELYSSIKKIDSKCVFGISPAGNIDNCRAAGADIDTWLSNNGYIDYIMPQIYWTDDYHYRSDSPQVNMFTERCEAWGDLNHIGIPIYVGLALYNVGVDMSTDRGWGQNDGNLANQYMIAKKYGYSGFALFRYAWLDFRGQNIDNGMYTGYADADAKIRRYVERELDNLRNAITGFGMPNASLNDTGIVYSTHIQSFGWQSDKADGVLSGSTGLSKRLEGIKIKLGKKAGEGSVMYRTHVQTYGWMDWVSDGKMSGTEGQSKRMEAIQIKLTGKAAEKYDVYYRVHVQSFGWLDWAKNGQSAGSATFGKRLEAIQIKLVEKNGTAPGKTGDTYRSRMVMYDTHVQTYGWLGRSYDGEVSGTTGQSKRLEAIRISFPDSMVRGSIKYRVHSQTYGWLPWVSNGQLAGVTGQAKRLEAIEIALEGPVSEKYDIYYRVHCQGIGWMDWVSNGQLAGTVKRAKRLEAIQIKLVPKGSRP